MNVIVNDSIVNAKTELILLPMTITGAITSKGIKDMIDVYPDVFEAYQKDIGKIIINGKIDTSWLGKCSVVTIKDGLTRDVALLYCRDPFSGEIDIDALYTAVSGLHYKSASIETSRGYGDGRAIMDTVDIALGGCQVDVWMQ